MPEIQDSREPRRYAKSFFGVGRCEECGAEFENRRKGSRFCSKICRTRHSYPTPGSFGPSLCVFCGSPYEKIRRDQRCCSAACSLKNSKIETNKKRADSRAESRKAVVCLKCGKAYIPNRSDQKFCSVGCRNRYRSVVYVPVQPSARSCIVCGKTFDGVRRERICSPACRDVRKQSLVTQRIERLFGVADFKCKQCGKTFTPKSESKAEKRKPEFCGYSCKAKNFASKTGECKVCGKRYLVVRSPLKSESFCSTECRDRPVPCDICGRPFVRRQTSRKYCSKKCTIRAANPPLSLTAPMVELECSECGRRYQANTHIERRFCSPRCMKRPNRRKRRAMERAAFVEDVPMSYLIERDDATCQICLKPVDLEATVPDPMAPTIDHVKPLSKGGLHTKFNTQLAHFSCNTKKGANT